LQKSDLVLIQFLRTKGGTTQKTNKNMMAKTIPREIKRGRPKKGQKMLSPKGPKRGRELVFLMVESYLTHKPSYVTSMQIMGFNSSGRSRTNITYQNNLPLYNRG
jgi:hypothetical protein